VIADVRKKYMSSEKVTLLYKATQDAQQRFEYFVTGVTGAMFAYISQTYTPQKIDFSASTLEPIALVFLAVSFFLGLMRINYLYHSLGMNYEQLEASESAKAIGQALRDAEPHKNHLPPEQQKYMNEWNQEMKALQDRSQVARGFVDKLNRQGETFYSLRNIFLVAGFASVALARILEPYSK
jgi:hypothetical protein